MSHTLYIILAGRAWVVMADSQNREVILTTLRVGDYVKEMSMIDGEAHSATVEAEVQRNVLELERKAFKQCLKENLPIADAIMRRLCRAPAFGQQEDWFDRFGGRL